MSSNLTLDKEYQQHAPDFVIIKAAVWILALLSQDLGELESSAWKIIQIESLQELCRGVLWFYRTGIHSPVLE